MSVILFILVLLALIVVHEFGHFVVAKWSGMRVDEFGVGYPPRARAWKYGETEYSVNWLPFGGFVRIYGEDEQDRVEGTGDVSRAFGSRPRVLQALTLFAGIAMNLLFAWVLISGILAIGTVRALTPEEVPYAKDAALMVSNVLAGSPGAEAGLKAGDAIKKVVLGDHEFTGVVPTDFTSFIASDSTQIPLTITVLRGGTEMILTATPKAGVIANDPTRPALGLAVATAGTVPVTWWKAPIEGAKLTAEITKETAIGLWQFFSSIALLNADLTQVSGPIGIAGAVGTASSHGLVALLTLTAIISINLALINLLPIPALDGGRLLFVAIEAVIRRPLPVVAARAVNTVGFAFLILLMVVVSFHDVLKFFT
ncbi:MAG: M50 family metallopeptidase [Patescibacteria group bacterium]